MRTPTPLANAVHDLASNLMELAVRYLAGAKNADPEQAGLISDGDKRLSDVAELCK